MNKTKEKIIDNLFKKGILNTFFNDENFGKDFNLFQNKLVKFIIQQQEVKQ